MIVTGSIFKVREVIAQAKKKGKQVGFVPTMGALHAGHLSLIKQAKKDCSFVVASIFVNPVQFGPQEDFSAYPRTLKEDTALLKKENVDLCFIPAAAAMYPPGFSVYVEETRLSRVLCGRSRPGHFRGVCTVVGKLFNIVAPDIAYFGQKDYQQAQIIKRLAQDLNFTVKIKVLPIVREKDGLALSSRNSYLNAKERQEAGRLYAALQLAEQLIKEGERDPAKIIDKMEKLIFSAGGKIDYVKIVDAGTLENIHTLKGKVLIALAVYVGKTRLIDNVVINLK